MNAEKENENLLMFNNTNFADKKPIRQKCWKNTEAIPLEFIINCQSTKK